MRQVVSDAARPTVLDLPDHLVTTDRAVALPVHVPGTRVRLQGVTVAELDGDRIRRFRQYWDEVALLE